LPSPLQQRPRNFHIGIICRRGSEAFARVRELQGA
jgi:hypothetical protein